MKITFTLLLTASAFILQAQPVLQSSDFMTIGTTSSISVGAAVPTGSGGANQTWNFSSMSLTPAGTCAVIDPTASPYGATFPGSNICMQLNLPNGTQYSYHNVSVTGVETLGDQVTASGGDNYTPNSKTWFVFPYTFGQSFSDAWMRTTDITTDTVTRTYDGYGTLIMPFGTFNNVVRVTSTNSANNTVWFNSNPIYPILQVEGNTSIVFSNFVLGINNPVKEQVVIAPNPAKDIVHIQNGNCRAFTAYSSTGQSIALPVDGNTINISSLAAGLYIIRAEMNNGDVVTQRIVKE